MLTNEMKIYKKKIPIISDSAITINSLSGSNNVSLSLPFSLDSKHFWALIQYLVRMFIQKNS